MKTNARGRLAAIVAAATLLASAAGAQAQFRSWIGYLPERYVIIQRAPVYYYDDRDESPGYYLYDYVNRPNPLTPEPIWRDMFPGIRARVAAERRSFGISGQSGREMLYWRNYR